MALVDKIDPGSGYVASDVRISHITGVMIDSATNRDDGELIPDEYTLGLSGVSSGHGTVTINTASINNPFNGLVFTGVLLNGSTVRSDIIPGLDLVFHTGSANGNSTIIYVGSYFGAISSEGIGDGIPVDGILHKVTNTSDGSISEAKARILTQAIQVKKIGSVFSFMGSFADGAVEKVVGGGSSRIMPYALTISSVAGSGPTKTVSLSVDTVLLPLGSIRDELTGVHQSGALLKAVTGQSYQIMTGNLTGLVFSIDPACANSDSTNVLIFYNRYAEIAPDLGGVAGAYGVVDVDLTEDTFPTGVISASGSAYYWVRVRVPGASNNESNPYPANVALVGVDSGSAGW